MKYAIYRSNPYTVGGAYRLVLRQGKPILFKNRKQAETWMGEAHLTSKVKGTTFEVRRYIKEVK